MDNMFKIYRFADITKCRTNTFGWIGKFIEEKKNFHIMQVIKNCNYKIIS